MGVILRQQWDLQLESVLPLRRVQVQPSTTKRTMENWFIVHRSAKWYSHPRDTWLLSYKTEQTPTTPTYIIISITNYPKEWKKLYSQKKRLYTSVCRSFIHNCQNSKAIKTPSWTWMKKQTIDHYPSLKWDELSSRKRRLKCTLLRSGYLLRDFNYIEHSRKGRTMEIRFDKALGETDKQIQQRTLSLLGLFYRILPW